MAMVVVNIVVGVTSILAILLLALRSSRHAKQQEEIKRRFLEEEEAANAVRKRDIDPELFYTADLSALPQIAAGDPHQVERSAKRTMIRFEEPISNLELKKQYGLSQMDIIAQYEENFIEYLKALTNWAEELVKENNPADAITILETAISLGAEFRNTYKLAADIYAANIDETAETAETAIENLLDRAEKNHFSDPSIRRQILEHINKKKDELAEKKKNEETAA